MALGKNSDKEVEKRIEANQRVGRFKSAVTLLNSHDGQRFEAVRYLTAKMKRSDLRLITDHCISLERANSK